MVNAVKAFRFLCGTRGKIQFRLDRPQLEELVKNVDNQELSKELQELLTKAENPSLKIAAKAKSNYVIGGFRFKDGEKTLAQGAVSQIKTAESFCQENPVIKARLSLGEDGKIGQMSGFIDTGLAADVQDVALNSLRKGESVTLDVTSKGFGLHSKVDNAHKTVASCLEFIGADEPKAIVDAISEYSLNGRKKIINGFKELYNYMFMTKAEREAAFEKNLTETLKNFEKVYG